MQSFLREAPAVYTTNNYIHTLNEACAHYRSYTMIHEYRWGIKQKKKVLKSVYRTQNTLLQNVKC